MAKREQINAELVAQEKCEAKRRDGPAARSVSNGGSVSREDFDWACQIYRGTLDAAGIESLQKQLHPGQPVVGTPELVFAGTDGF